MQTAATAFVLVAAAVQTARADAFDALDKSFVDAYHHAAVQTLARLRREAPIIVNLFDRIVLYRPGAAPLTFKMDLRQYMEATGASHAAAALYVRIVPSGFGALDGARLAWLHDFVPQVDAALHELDTRADIPPALRQSQRTLLENVKALAERLRQNKRVTPDDFADYSDKVASGIRASLDFAAQSQLSQFREQVEIWQRENRQLAWDKAVVLVITLHQPRNDNLQRQFFDWAYPDTPAHEDRVVLAEAQQPPNAMTDETLASYMSLLSKVMLDKDFAQTVFRDRYALQTDVLGWSATEIIKTWPRRAGQ